MGRTAGCKVLWLACLPCCCLLGCQTVNVPATARDGQPDSFLEELVKQETLVKGPKSATLKPDVVLKEIPLQTSLEQARSILAGHGFSCWAGVPGPYGPCLHCTAYKRKNQFTADRIVVRLYYQNKRVVNADVMVDYEVVHSEGGFFASH